MQPIRSNYRLPKNAETNNIPSAYHSLNMKNFCCTFIACIFIISASAQTTNYIPDADKLYQILQQTPSYKAQIKGDEAKRYRHIYEQVKQDLPKARTNFDRFYMLSQLLVPLKDNHLFFSEQPEKEITNAMLKDTAFIRQYCASDVFKEYPRSNVKLDSLEQALKNMPLDSIEGIYYFERVIKAGLYRTSKPDSLVAVILQSPLANWMPGQIAFVLIQTRPNYFRNYQSHPLNKTFYLLSNEKFQHRMLTETFWKKEPDATDYVNIKAGTPLFQLKTMDTNTQYLRLGSFSTTPQNIASTQEFYSRIKDSLIAPNLIADLRNNGGGGFKTSQKFLDLLKKYTGKGKIYAVVNNRTVSNAEQFAVELKKMKGLVILGETTNGTLTYGNNYGNTEKLPGGRFKLYITDMKEDGNYLPYEGIGVSPDVFLDPNSEWLPQVMQMIAKREVVK